MITASSARRRKESVTDDAAASSRSRCELRRDEQWLRDTVSQSLRTSQPNPGDQFSDYDDGASETQSLISCILNYTFENGRRYASYGSQHYLLPNDEDEQERLDITHHIFKLTLGGEMCVTKLTNPQRILDVGTGTGIWAMEIGDLYPGASIIGTDISPIQPQWVPPNVEFQIEDATQAWTFPKASFDFIHVRMLGGSIHDWPFLLRQCWEALKPGGKLEIAEGRARLFCDDDSWPKDPDASYLRYWITEFHRIEDSIGVKFDSILDIPDLATDAGFTDVGLVQKFVPLGTWPKDRSLKEIGHYAGYSFTEQALEAYSLALFLKNGWTRDEVQVLLAHVRREFKEKKMHVYTFMSYVTCVKAEDASE